MKATNDWRFEELEAIPVVQYYKEFSANSWIKQNEIIRDYDLYLEMSKTSKAGQIFYKTREALSNGDMSEVKRLGQEARELRASGDFEEAPQPFDPKYIGNQSQVSEYRKLMAKRSGNIPTEFKEALLWKSQVS